MKDGARIRYYTRGLEGNSDCQQDGDRIRTNIRDSRQL